MSWRNYAKKTLTLSEWSFEMLCVTSLWHVCTSRKACSKADLSGQPRDAGTRHGIYREKIQEKTDEFLKCLKENYPDEAAKLEQIKKDNPEQYMRAMMISGKKYGRFVEAVKDDPNLAKVLKQQMELKDKRSELLKQIRATTDEKQKKTLTTELEQIVGQQFDLIVKRKQMAYEDLTKKLADLQKEVDQKKTEVEKWKSKDFKSQKDKGTSQRAS